MNLEKFGPFTVYWCEASIIGDAKLYFSASSFSLNDESLWPLLTDIQDNLEKATEFFLQKKIELCLDNLGR